jgi:CheY-like chemotaxis protein
MYSVLLIDDEEVDSMIFSKILHHVAPEIKVLQCNNGHTALTFLNQLTALVDWPTHIFIDINMPIMDGFEFIDEYLKIQRLRGKYSNLFILSSSDSPADIKRAERYQCITKFLVKPITVQKIEKLFEFSLPEQGKVNNSR